MIAATSSGVSGSAGNLRPLTGEACPRGVPSVLVVLLLTSSTKAPLRLLARLTTLSLANLSKLGSSQLELLLGRDLQFIHINGTVVGAGVGLALHAIAMALA